MGMALSGKVVPYKKGFGSMMNDVYRVPFPIALHAINVSDTVTVMDKLFEAEVDPARVSEVILEPVQDEGGFYEAPKESTSKYGGLIKCVLKEFSFTTTIKSSGLTCLKHKNSILLIYQYFKYPH